MNGPQKISEPVSISVAHPAFAGHFPGIPIVPGVVLLDEAFAVIGKSRRIAFSSGQLASAKFHSPVLPGEAVIVEHEMAANGSVRFTLRAGDRLVAAGVWIPRAGSG